MVQLNGVEERAVVDIAAKIVEDSQAIGVPTTSHLAVLWLPLDPWGGQKRRIRIEIDAFPEDFE